MKKWISLLALMLPAIAPAQPYSLDWFKVAGGGGTSTGGVYCVSDTIGQPDAGGSIGGGGYSVTFGFWSLLGQGTPAFVPVPPIITGEPQSLIVPIGSPVSFNVSVSGTPPLFYQWQKNGADLSDGGNISGSATSNLVLSTTSTNDTGLYTVVINNTFGNQISSSAAKLTLILPAYYATDIGSLGGGYAYATAINNNGQIVGDSSPVGNPEHPFLYSGGTMSDLGLLSGGTDGAAQAINNNGQVVGWCYGHFDGGNAENSFLYSGGTMTDLDGNYDNNVAYGINDSGQIVGYCAWFSYNFFSGYTYLGDIPYSVNASSINNFTDLGNLGSENYSSANAINDNGQIVGESETSSGNYHAFLYSSGTMSDLGTLGGSFSDATGVNNNGQVVGYATTAGNAEHAFLYNGTMTDLGTLGGTYSYAYGINDGGQIVGDATVNGNIGHAFLYDGGAMFDLNTLVNTNSLGTYLYSANGINDSGQIAANGENGHAYLLTPSLPGSYATGSFPPGIQLGTVAQGQWTFNWKPVNTYPAVGYQVQSTTNLMCSWVNVGSVIINGNTSFTVPIGTNSLGFYRVLLVQ